MTNNTYNEIDLYKQYLKNIITYTYLASKPKTITNIDLDISKYSLLLVINDLLEQNLLPISTDQITVVLDGNKFKCNATMSTCMSNTGLLILLISKNDLEHTISEDILAEDCKIISIRV